MVSCGRTWEWSVMSGTWPSKTIMLCSLLAVGVLAHGLVFTHLPLVPTNDAVWYLGLTSQASGGQIFDLYAPGEPTTYDVHYPFGYPLLLDALIALFGFPGLSSALALFQHLLSVGSALLVFWLGGVLGSWRAGFVSALLYLCYFQASYYSQIMMSETVFTFSSLAALSLVVLWLRSRALFALVGAGTLLGVAMCIRPVALVLPMVVGPFLLMRRAAAEPRMRLLEGIGLLAPILFCVAALILNNQLRYDRATFSDSLGRHLADRVWHFDGLIDRDEPKTQRIIELCARSGVEHRIPSGWWNFYKALRVGSGLSSAESDQLLTGMALGTMLRHPVHYTVNSFRGFARILTDEDKWPPPLGRVVSRDSFGRYLQRWSATPPRVERSRHPRREFEARRSFLRDLEIDRASAGGGFAPGLLELWRDYTFRYDGLWVVPILLGSLALLVLGGTAERLVVLATLAIMLPPALVEYPYARYREPAVPLLILILCLAAGLLVSRIRER
jgi:4-amino-4-deoxy-L-arabinose transferase-like glycosyltransferase